MVITLDMYDCMTKKKRKERFGLSFTVRRRAVCEPRAAAGSFRSSGRSRSAGASRAMSLAAHACPSARRCCSCRTCEPTRCRCAAPPRCGSTAPPRAALPTTSPPASPRGRSGGSARPTCPPISTTHRLPTAPPTCPCTSCCHLYRRTSPPICRKQHRIIMVQSRGSLTTSNEANQIPLVPNVSMASLQWCPGVDAAPLMGPFFSLPGSIIVFPPLLLPLLALDVLPPFVRRLFHMD